MELEQVINEFTEISNQLVEMSKIIKNISFSQTFILVFLFIIEVILLRRN